MKKEKVHYILSVSAELLKTNPLSLEIEAKGVNTNSNYSNVRLEPAKTEPVSGIWEFNMVGEVPEIVDGIITPVGARYTWKGVPPDVRGVRVNGAINGKTALIGHHGVLKTSDAHSIEILKAEAWDNAQPVQPTPGGTLHVNLEYNASDHGIHSLKKAVPQGINPKILLLDLTSGHAEIFFSNPRHNSYTEGLTAIGQYTSIDIIYKGEIVCSITSIPIIE